MAMTELTEVGLARALAIVEGIDAEAAERITAFTPGMVPRVGRPAERAFFEGELAAFLAEEVVSLRERVAELEKAETNRRRKDDRERKAASRARQREAGGG